MPTSTQSVKFTALTATTTAAFALNGGKYAIVIAATGTAGTAVLQIQAADGTFIPVNAGVTAAPGGYAVVDLPAGQYNFTTTVLTGVSVSITSIPD